jgi:hypothetical protein
MVVRVKIRLKTLKGKKGKTMDVVALLNAGFESDEPEMVIPVGVAERLGLWPRLPEDTEIESYEVAGSRKVRTYYIEDCLESQVITEDTSSNLIKIPAVIMEDEPEILASDKLIRSYQIVLEDAGSGIWRFRNEKKLRGSESPEYW